LKFCKVVFELSTQQPNVLISRNFVLLCLIQIFKFPN